ncbi:hypothetical protein GGI00_006010, partial [Coemansia sp. RSA 2681]
MSGGEHGYNWDSLVSGSSTVTPGTDTGGVHHNNNLKTFSGTADDDWSDLLNLAGSTNSASAGSRPAGFPGMGLGRLSISDNSSTGLAHGDASNPSARHRRQLVDMIQTDFPRTPSPAIDSNGIRVRAPNALPQRQGSVDGSGMTSSLAPDVAASSQSPSSSAFSAMSASVPMRGPPNFASPAGLLSDTNILGIPTRQHLASSPNRLHSAAAVAAASPGDDASLAPNVGQMVSSLLDQEEESDRRHSQVDIFGLSAGSPPGPAAALANQSLWAARHAARLDGMQRAASTPPRNAVPGSVGHTNG